MKRILVIADDFTGAAEIGGIAVEFGLNAHLGFRRIPSANADALVVDTDTRNLPAADAANRLKQILHSVDRSQFDQIYKKTDSVLRGPIAAELTAIMGSLEFDRSLLIPQNPSRSRIIENGRYFIAGIPLDKTSFAADPGHPATTSDVIALLDPNKHFGVRSIRSSTFLDESGITIGDGGSEQDLNRWAPQLHDRTLAAGGADFFRSILRTRGLVPSNTSLTLPQTSRAMFVCGSASDESRRFIATLRHVCPMPPALFDPASAAKVAFEEWHRSICQEIEKSGRVFVTVGHEPIPDRATHVRQTFAEITALVLASHPAITLFVEGGATAANVIERMGWSDMAVLGQLCVGVGVLSPNGNPNQLLIVKPGSYPWPPVAVSHGAPRS